MRSIIIWAILIATLNSCLKNPESEDEAINRRDEYQKQKVPLIGSWRTRLTSFQELEVEELYHLEELCGVMANRRETIELGEGGVSTWEGSYMTCDGVLSPKKMITAKWRKRKNKWIFKGKKRGLYKNVLLDNQAPFSILCDLRQNGAFYKNNKAFLFSIEKDDGIFTLQYAHFNRLNDQYHASQVHQVMVSEHFNQGDLDLTRVRYRQCPLQGKTQVRAQVLKKWVDGI